ncbi:MAG: WYL domain-containing protein [Bacteroidales bacterium]|nr:WYL domain-containing protein [Candidatus Cryptobacteroides caccocaballi]
MTIQQLSAKYKETSPETINDFIWELRSCVRNSSVASLQLLGFLDGIINEFRPKAQALCDTREPADEQSVNEVLMHAKILCAQMIVLQNIRSYRELSEKMLLLLEWCSCFGSSGENAAGTAIKSLCRQCTETGLTWDIIRNAVSVTFLAYNVLSGCSFDGDQLPPLTYNGKGSVSIENGAVYVSSSMGWSGGAKAWEGLDSSLMVYTRNTRDEKLKLSYLNNAAQLDQFARAFTESQNNAASAVQARVNREVKTGDKVIVKVEDIEEGQPLHMIASAMQTTLEKKGVILNEELIKGIWTEDLIPYIFDGDCIKGAVIENTDGEPEFSIKESYRSFAKQAAELDNRNNTVFEAVAVFISEETSRINWMTAGGYGAISPMIEGIKVGTKMVMTVKNVQTKGATYINIEPPKYGYDHIDRIFNEEEVLSSFISMEKDVWKELDEQTEKKPEDRLAKESKLRSLSRIILNSRCSSSIECYRTILSALFISNCIGDDAGVRMARVETAYLGTLLNYAQGTPSRTDTLPDMSPERRYVVKCLAAHQTGTLQTIIPLLSSAEGDTGLASLIAAQFISRDFSDEVKADNDTVRRSICTILGVEDGFVESGAAATGKYGSTENRNLEFKASYVFRNDNGEPDLIHQGRDQVFEAVCGFLNRDGGTVYVGVNNSGDPILSENSGISGDMAWFRANFYSSVLPKRLHQLGHGTPLPDTLDHYALFLSQEKELYFKESILDKITIEPTEDEDAIRIIVKPSLYEIAYLYEDETHTKGIAYVRDAGSTLPMSEKQKEERLMNQKQISKEVQFAVILQQACDLQHKVILKGYHSGNSGEVRDRLVVPINLFYNDENVLCYDLEAHAERQFRLSRITAIETGIPNPKYTHCFKKKTADVFRWIGDESYHIKVRMEVGAYNYLIEEYSMAKNLPSEELYMEEDGHWILDTHLHGLGAIRRFYLGLADKMEILETEDSEKLIKDIKEFLKTMIALS